MSDVTVLGDGLTVVTERVPSAETVAIGLFLNAGTRDERPQEHGLAHFLEHMAFKGTATRSALQTVADIEALGGDINAETSPDTTSYTVRMLAEDWKVGLDVLLDIVCQPVFRADDIALEQDVVLQEIAGAMDLPDDRLVDGLGLAAFPDQAIGRPILGTPDTVRALSAASLDQFRARTYAPGGTVISAAGAIDHGDLVEAVQAWSPCLPARDVARRTTPQVHAGRFGEVRDTFDTHLALAWPAPAFAAPGSMAHALAVQMLGGGMTSRLFQSIREEAGLAYAIDAYQMIYADCGLGVIQTATSKDKVGQLKTRLLDEMSRFAETADEAALASAKRQFRASLAMASESVNAHAARNARQLAVLGTLRSRATLEDEIARVDLAQVQSCWRSILEAGRFTHAAIGSAHALDLWLN